MPVLTEKPDSISKLSAAVRSRKFLIPEGMHSFSEISMEEKLRFMEEISALAQTNITAIFDPVSRLVETIKNLTAPITKSFERLQESFTVGTQWARPSFVPTRPVHTFPFSVTNDVTSTEPVVQLPKEARWEDVNCRFKDPQTLSVFCEGKLIGHYDHATLGFARENTKMRNPDKQWELLMRLSVLYEKREFSSVIPIVGMLKNELQISEDAFYKRMGSLSHKLQQAFGIDDDPFQEYDPALGYQLKFRLTPEPLLRGDGELHPSGGRLIEEITSDNAEDEE